ncbi:DNA replication regulator sld2 [Histoplasma capsulatum var. duboisii H88]|uniref:DNA replication regulator SLD2 n=1 Tax=Ajellomyces capsulatus (strain H88) TaxID=544711 RepID=F0UFN0_AJEC8|nr:DNA replication regulator sld2 [Histoplasma capsulatum var. duboisii H88]QSS55758.1 DNA replication regulator sld2 [Histoplasma capsulatum var. duboisii H88]
MADHQVPHNEEQQPSSTLRAELKEWERAFTAANGGRKPGRDDIKNNPAISAKYKLYSRLRAQSSQANSSSFAPAQEAPQQRKRKRPLDTQEDVNGLPPPQSCSTPRKPSENIPATPDRRFLSTSTALCANAHPSQLDPYDSPSTLRRFFSPSYHRNFHEDPHSSSSPLPLRAAIGPTPQRDGKALGLFDLLCASGGSNSSSSRRRRRDSAVAAAATPCLRHGKRVNNTNNQGIDNPMQTPSRRKESRINSGDQDGEDGDEVADKDNDDYENFFASTRTPASSAKKFYLANFFATPPAYRYSAAIDTRADSRDGANDNQPASNNDPSNGRSGPPAGSKDALGSDTPSFLRRRNLFSSSSSSMVNSRQHVGVVGGVSVHDLSPVAVRMPQKLVGKGLSAIVQGLRDIQEERLDEELDLLREMEAEAAVAADIDDAVVINDSQVPLRDGSGGGDDDDEGNTLAMRRWKKKGQKRTTRRVVMRPVRAKAKPMLGWPVAVIDGEGDGDGDRKGGSGDELAAISETQLQPQLPPEPGANKENETLARPETHTETKKEIALTNISTSIANANVSVSASAAKLKPATMKGTTAKVTTATNQKHKTKPDAHANYRALKIRGKGSNARGKGRRFGRR